MLKPGLKNCFLRTSLRNKMKVCFIIVEPAVPENVGAIARAINTMGFGELRLVNPCNHLDEKALWLAHGSHEILHNASLFSKFEDAIQDIDLIIGTTAKKRKVKQDYLPASKLKELVISKSPQSMAIVFGREESGLNNIELMQCHIISSIPLIKPYPSLNLAQAVMLYAYELSFLNINKVLKNNKTDLAQTEILIYLANEVIKLSGLSDNKNLSNRILERINHLNNKDSKLLLSTCRKIIGKFNEKEGIF